jgi:hypothetical protein
MTTLLLISAAILFFYFWSFASRYLKPFVSTYLGMALWFFWMALFGAAFHFLR